MAYLQKTIGEFTLGSTVGNADFIPYEQGGVTKRIPFETFKTTIPNYGYLTATFGSGDLSGNILTINHAKNTLLAKVIIFTPAGIWQPLPYTIVDANNVQLLFAVSPTNNQYRVVIVG